MSNGKAKVETMYFEDVRRGHLAPYLCVCYRLRVDEEKTEMVREA